MALSTRRLPSLLRVPASPVPRSQRYYEGATTSRLRTRGRLLVRFHAPRDPPPSCLATALPQVRRSLAGQGLVVAGRPKLRLSHVDVNGISQVFRRSFLCLCCGPGPRSNRRVLAMTVTSMLPPLCGRRRLRHWLISGLTRSFGTCCHTLHAWRCRTRARLASGWLARLGREGVEPSGSLRKVSARLTIILLSCSPDATAFRFGRGRDASYLAPPAQIRTCGFPAYGSHLG
jgi:hypothetical protein